MFRTKTLEKIDIYVVWPCAFFFLTPVLMCVSRCHFHGRKQDFCATDHEKLSYSEPVKSEQVIWLTILSGLRLSDG